MAAPHNEDGAQEGGALPQGTMAPIMEEAGSSRTTTGAPSATSSSRPHVEGGALSSRATTAAFEEERLPSVPGTRAIYGKRPTSVAKRRQSKLFVGMMHHHQQEDEDEDDFEHDSKQRRRALCWRPKVIMPTNRWYSVFWYFTMGWALFNAIADPYKVAFGSAGGFEPYNDFWAVTEFLGTFVFLIDIILKFFVAFEDTENREMVTDLHKIQLHYLRLLFWLDLLFWFPFVGVINSLRPDFHSPENTRELEYANLPDSERNTALYIGLLAFLKLGRLYRIFYLFDQLEHAMVMSQMSLMLTRNFFYVILTCHWFACIFYFIARAEGFDPLVSWVGRSIHRFDNQSPFVVYIYSFYVSVMCFTAIGDNDLYVNSVAESIAMSVYLLFNVVLGAYILGTVTMLMVKGDQRSAQFRDRITNLKDYITINALPKELHEAMRKHIELHFHSELSSDELVLAPYPAALKKRALRHLYLQPLRECYLFHSCKPKFLDAILAVCRTELFMPNVQLISDGDIVSDLNVVIEGEVEIIHTASENSSSGPNMSKHMPALPTPKARRASFFVGAGDIATPSMKSMTGSRSKTGGIEKRCSSETFGEIAFFTETPSNDGVWTCQVTRVLVIPRSAYDDLVKAYPSQVRQVMAAVKTKAEKMISVEIMEVLDSVPHTSNSLHERINQFLDETGNLTTVDLPKPVINEVQALFNTYQMRKWEQLELISSTFARFCAKQDQQVVLDLLSYAETGEEEDLLHLLHNGVDPSCADYDHRSPLMIAAREGQAGIVSLLIRAGANIHAQDVFGTTALVEAIKRQHDHVADLLIDAGATLGASTAAIRDYACQRVVKKDIVAIDKLLEAGVDPNITTFDDRTLLHLAAAQGDYPIVRLLVDAGANAQALDRWQHQPVDDARRSGNQKCIELLEKVSKPKPDGSRTLASLHSSKSFNGNGNTNTKQTILTKAGPRRRRRLSVMAVPPTKSTSGLPDEATQAPRRTITGESSGILSSGGGPLGSPTGQGVGATAQRAYLMSSRQHAAEVAGWLQEAEEEKATMRSEEESEKSVSERPGIPIKHFAAALMGAAEDLMDVRETPREVATITPRDVLVLSDPSPRGRSLADTTHESPSTHEPPSAGTLAPATPAHAPKAQPQGVGAVQEVVAGVQRVAGGVQDVVEESPVEMVAFRQSLIGNIDFGPKPTTPLRIAAGASGRLPLGPAPESCEFPDSEAGEDEEAGEEERAVAALAKAAEKVAWGGAGAGPVPGPGQPPRGSGGSSRQSPPKQG